MQIPIVSNLRELSPAPRRFLVFMCFNVCSWQCVVGPAMVLFARELGMPESWVGYLLAAMPLSMLLVLTTVPLVTHLGPKRLMMWTWGGRNLLMCGVFFVPLVMRGYGTEAAWYVVLASTIGFCVVRAVGAGGWIPWIYELVPDEERNTYFSAEIAVSHLVTVVIVGSQGLILPKDPSIAHFMAIYGIGIAAGFASLVWMSRVPGGKAHPDKSQRESTASVYRKAAGNRPFVLFLLVVGGGMVCAYSLESVLVLYLRDQLELASDRIMYVMAAASTGVMLTIRFWGKFADYSGSRLVMAKTLFARSVVAFSFLLFPPSFGWSKLLVPISVVLLAVFWAAYWMAIHRALLGYVEELGKVGFTSLWTCTIAISLGVTPIVTGHVVEILGFTGFRLCILVSGIGGIIFSLLSLLMVQDGHEKVKGSVIALLNPALPIRTLARVIWITAGQHESSRR